MKKRTEKLAVHVGIIVTIMFFITNIATGIMTVIGTKNMYLESNNEQITRDITLYKNLYMNPDIVPIMVDAWENDPDLIKRPYTKDEEDIRDVLTYMGGYAYELTPQDIEEMDPDEKKSYIKALYDIAAEKFEKERDEKKFDRLYCMDIHDDGNVFVIMEISEFTKKNDHGIGKQWYADPSIYTKVGKILSGEPQKNPDEVLFEQIYRSDSKNYLYVAYAPVYINGKLRYVMCEEYNWTHFSKILHKNIQRIIWFTVASVLLMDVILLILLYFHAVRPVKKVNDGVREYMETKDSVIAASKMKAVRSRNEIGVLAESFSELVEEIERYTNDIKNLTKEREKVATELALAAKIQQDMLPEEFPDRAEFRLYALMKPAKEVGGDFYDYFFIDDEHIGLVIADVSDKGIPAALLMMMSKILIKNYAMTGASPAEVMNRTNRNIYENNKNMMFVTAWFGVLDIKTGHVKAVNAGHEYPIIRHEEGSFELFKDEHRFVLGMEEADSYNEYEFDLGKGDTLFLYTDGVSEATNAEDQLFGTGRMIDTLNLEPGVLPERLLENMRSAIDSFVGDMPQFDDLTMLCIRYNG